MSTGGCSIDNVLGQVIYGTLLYSKYYHQCFQEEYPESSE